MSACRPAGTSCCCAQPRRRGDRRGGDGGPYLAPFWSGLLFGFPTNLAPTCGCANGHYGGVFAARALLASRVNQSAYATLCVTLWIVGPSLSAPLAVVVAFIAGMAVATVVALAFHRHTRG